MARLFVFGIGGTGARVIKSLTMLLASGIQPGDFEIVPILIDPHESLEELNNCNALLKLYGSIHNQAYKDVTEEIKSGYFFTKLSSLASIAPETGIVDGFNMDGNYEVTFGQFLEKSNLPRESKTGDFLSLLYSQNENFSKSLSVGFKGNPNVGSVVLNTMKDTQFYKAFETAFGAKDRIFIVSSIFGGTGAAGFPLLLKNLRQHKNMNIRDAQIGAITVMPYFKLSDPNGDGTQASDIDSRNFLTKTKSALTYYIKNITNLNALYYIADPDEMSKAYKNNELEQKDATHLIEFLSAYSIIHFANHNFNTRTQEIFEYCLKSNEREIHFKNLGDETSDHIAVNLTSLYLFNRVHKAFKEKEKLPLRITSRFNSRFFNDNFFSNYLEDFLDNHFERWIKELAENERGFNPFTLSDKWDFSNTVKAYKVHKRLLPGLISRPFDVSDVFVNMAILERKYYYLNKVNRKNQYLSMAYGGINKSILNHLPFKQ